MAILSLNAGSSSLKFALFDRAAPDRVGARVLSGSATGLERGAGSGSFTLEWQVGATRQESRISVGAGENAATGDATAAALGAVRQLLARPTGATAPAVPHVPAVIAHRIVHGGMRYRAPVRIDAAVLTELDALCPLAPLHQPHNLLGVRACLDAFPGVPQVACFDTAFHATLPAVEQRFALPEELFEQGVRRYGFHGLSYQYVQGKLERSSARGRGRVLLAHLGNGASLCATVGGQSRATTMGLSALDGLMMGTRSGSVDPGVLLHLLRQGWSGAALEDLLYWRSGLLGVSGLAADLRVLRASAAPAAARAIELFTHRVVREAGALTACIGGLDVLVFTGGIGQHDAGLRAGVCAALGYLGVELDAGRNAAADGALLLPLHAASSAVEVWLIPTDEERMAAALALGVVTAAADCGRGGR